MKSITFCRLYVSLTMLAGSAAAAIGCGPYAPLIPTPDFFELSDPHPSMAAYDRDENLRLWQLLTSETIPPDDIEEAVYHDSLDRFYDRIGTGTGDSDNLFYTYLNNAGDMEIVEFLALAKRLEEGWAEIRSPWYYPADRNFMHSPRETGDFSRVIERLRGYSGKRLRDRYSLQIARALFASRRYADCIEYTDSAFADIPDDNLMKRMAQRYAAGCWSRLGETSRADSVFARAGDIWSLRADDPVEYMARHNPGARQLIDYIRCNAADTSFMRRIIPIAQRVLRDKRVTNKGDWNFAISYAVNTYDHDARAARKYICRALRESFSSVELSDIARAYRMKLDGLTGRSDNLLADLKWIEGKTDILRPDAETWIRRIRNIIYADWIPGLWKRKDYSVAIMLCAYADNIEHSEGRIPARRYISRKFSHNPCESLTVAEIRDSEVFDNDIDYGCLSFQLMGSLSSSELASVYAGMAARSLLFDFLRRKIRTDRDYYYELIGTLALREEKYARAVRYLSKVSDHYLLTMNIDKGGYLSRDPFSPYGSRRINDGDPDGWEDVAAAPHKPASHCRAKLEFARRMQEYQYKKRFSSSADQRGLARLMYAIGRRNSFEECWALTQYWRGWVGIFEPSLQYWDDGFYKDHYDFLYDYYDTWRSTEEIYQTEIDASLAMLSSDEARAKAEYILGNLATVVRRYGDTTTARHVRASCDRWSSWL